MEVDTSQPLRSKTRQKLADLAARGLALGQVSAKWPCSIQGLSRRDPKRSRRCLTLLCLLETEQEHFHVRAHQGKRLPGRRTCAFATWLRLHLEVAAAVICCSRPPSLGLDRGFNCIGLAVRPSDRTSPGADESCKKAAVGSKTGTPTVAEDLLLQS